MAGHGGRDKSTRSHTEKSPGGFYDDHPASDSTHRSCTGPAPRPRPSAPCQRGRRGLVSHLHATGLFQPHRRQRFCLLPPLNYYCGQPTSGHCEQSAYGRHRSPMGRPVGNPARNWTVGAAFQYVSFTTRNDVVSASNGNFISQSGQYHPAGLSASAFCLSRPERQSCRSLSIPIGSTLSCLSATSCRTSSKTCSI